MFTFMVQVKCKHLNEQYTICNIVYINHTNEHNGVHIYLIDNVKCTLSFVNIKT